MRTSMLLIAICAMVAAVGLPAAFGYVPPGTVEGPWYPDRDHSNGLTCNDQSGYYGPYDSCYDDGAAFGFSPYASPYAGPYASPYAPVYAPATFRYPVTRTSYVRAPGGCVNVYRPESPPLGAVFVQLPEGYSTIVEGGSTYYVRDGVYFQEMPYGYVVVPPLC